MAYSLAQPHAVRRWFCTFSLICGLLAGCGGGGGSGATAQQPTTPTPTNPGGDTGDSYQGVVTGATLDQTNTPGIANALLFELGFAPDQTRPLPASVGVQQLAKGQRPTQRKLRALQKNATTRAERKVTTERCLEGGSTRVDDQTNDVGIGAITLSFTNCIEDGVRTNGTLILRVDALNSLTEEPSDYTTTFQQLIADAESLSIVLNGSIHTEETSGRIVDTYNTISTYQPENLHFRLENFVVTTERLDATRMRQFLGGRFYHSTHGYIDVDTTEALESFDLDASGPRYGALLMQGAQSSAATIQYTGPGVLVVDLDMDGDGQIDRSLTANSSAWLTAPNFAPRARAGADAQVMEGQSHVFRGEGSDWENSALTYRWTIVSGPSFGPIPDGRSPTFTPDRPGSYVVQLTVTDDHRLAGTDTMFLMVQDNAPPVARGADRTVVERTQTTLDASGSTDHENDPLQYVWRLRRAPSGSEAPDLVVGMQASFAPEIPGQYVYELEVSDATGRSFDEVAISVDPLVTLMPIESFSLNGYTTPVELQMQLPFTVSPVYSGPPVAMSISSNQPWLKVLTTAPSTGAPVVIAVDPAELQNLHDVTYQAQLTVTPEGFSAQTQRVGLSMLLPRISHVSPYVGYADREQEVLVFGQNINLIGGLNVVIDGVEVSGPSTAPNREGRLKLPRLPVGEYTLHFKNSLGVVLPGGRYVVREVPSYSNSELPLPGKVESLEYDAERDVFYIVARSISTSQTEARRLQRTQSGWEWTSIPVASPFALTLTTDGQKLLVTSSDCRVFELDPETLAQTGSRARTECYPDTLGMIHALADGDVLVSNTDQWSRVSLYPDFTVEYLPTIHTPVHLLSHDRSRLIWAESPTIGGSRSIYVYDSVLPTYQQIAAVDPDTYFMPSNLAISGDGLRVMHQRDLYEEGLFVGSIDHAEDLYLTPALSRYGRRAVILDSNTNSLMLYNLAGGPPYPTEQSLGVLPTI